MAVSEVVERDVTTVPGTRAHVARRPGPAWTSLSQLGRSVPMIRLLAQIWAVPNVCRIGVSMVGPAISVHVLMMDDDRAGEAEIFEAERDYLNATTTHEFDLRVTHVHRIPEERRGELLAGSTTVLDR